jgi:hypothetical protein
VHDDVGVLALDVVDVRFEDGRVEQRDVLNKRERRVVIDVELRRELLRCGALRKMGKQKK